MTSTDVDPAVAGVRSADAGGAEQDGYFAHSRPDVMARVPREARRILDLGCGSGALGAALQRRQGAEVTGVELFEAAADAAAQRLHRVVRLNLDGVDGLPLPEGHFDAAVFADVLEHLRDPAALLRAVRPLLAPGGSIVCSIPNVKHWTVLVPLLVHDGFTYADAGLLDRTHVHFFTLGEFGAMLEETGYAATSVNASRLPMEMPSEYAVLGEVAGRLGADVPETLARLDAYQYLVVARPA